MPCQKPYSYRAFAVVHLEKLQDGGACSAEVYVCELCLFDCCVTNACLLCNQCMTVLVKLQRKAVSYRKIILLIC